MFNLGIEFITGFVDLVATFGFLLLAYKFSTLAKYYEVVAFKEISFGFRFLFLSYFIPFISVFIGMTLLGDIFEDFEDFAYLFIGLPATVCTIIAFWYFFKSVRSIISFANERECD